MDAFHLSWVIGALSLLVLAAAVGKFTYRKSFTGILIDDRGRYSLNRFQLVLWTILILSTFLALFFVARKDQTIPLTLLGLLGISVGTATVAGAVKDGKDTSGAVVQRGGAFVVDPATVLPSGEPWRLAPTRQLLAATARGPSGEPPVIVSIPPHFSQIILEEEGQFADKIVNVTKFQNFIFTVAVAVWYVAAVVKAPGYPTLPENIVWLLGISHAGYVAGKVPKKE
jgi:hypothetical protein